MDKREHTVRMVISFLLTMSENSIGKILIGRFQNSEKNGDLVGGIAMPERLNKHSPNLFQVWRECKIKCVS